MDIATGLKKVRQGVASISLATMLVSMLLTGVAQAAVANYNDVPAGAWYYTPVMTLANAGVVDGPSAVNNYNYNPSGSVNRAMMTKFAVLAAKFPLTNTSSFKDVDQAAWYAPYVNTAAAHGVVGGYKDVNGNLTGNFGPGDYVTRGQGAKILVNAFSLAAYTPANATFPDVNPTMWEYPFVETSAHWSVIKGNPDGTFKPAANMNRAELAQMVVGAMNPVALVTQPPVVSGALTVALASDTTKGTTIPSDATSVALMKVNFVAGASDVKINGLTIHKSGVSVLPSGFQGYLYNGNDRLTSGKSFSGTTDDMVFTNLNLSISKGNTLALTFKGDMGTVATTGNVQFQVKAIDSTAASVAGLPVTSSEFALSTTAVGSVTITKNGTVTNPKVGEDGVTIAKFKIAAATEAANIQQIGLYLAGTITTSDVENLKLYVSDKAEPLATVAAVNSKDIAAFVLATPYQIEKGGTRNFTVVADLNTGRNADTLKAYIDEKTDVVAVGDKYGFGMKVSIVSTDIPVGSYDGTGCTSSAGDCTFSTLEGGDITISSSGPTATDYSVNSKDVHLLNFNVTSVSNVTFKNFDVGLKTSLAEGTVAAGLLNSTTANFTDIKIINTKTGAVLTSAVDSTSFVTTDGGSTAIAEANDANQAYYLFSDDFTMAAGESLDLAITADIANNSALNTETLVASVQLGGTYPEVRDINNKVLTNTTSLVPDTDITGKTMTIKSAGLTMALAATPVADTFVKGAKDIRFAGYSFACGTASTCKVTDITLTGYVDETGDGSFTAGTEGAVTLNTMVGSVKLALADGTPVATAKSVQSDGTVAFSNLAWTLKAGETLTVYPIGDFSTNATAGAVAAFGITSANVTAEDKDGNTISSITGSPNVTPTIGMTASAGGDITVAVDSATPKENILVAGTADQILSKFKFTTTDEAFVVTKLGLSSKQDGVTTADLAEYANNYSKVKISYTNSLGATVTTSGDLTNGVAEFSGLDMYIGADKTAVLTVSADLNTIALGATAGEFVDLNIGFENFEAVAQGSGDTYKADKLDASVSAASDLDFGTITYTEPTNTFELASAQITTVTLGSTTTLLVDNAGGAPGTLPVGTVVCMDDGDNGVCSASEDIYIVTAWDICTSSSAPNAACSTDADGDTVYTDQAVATLLMVDDAGDNNYADASDLMYSLPGTGYLTGTNRGVVYKTKPTLALAAGSPSGSTTTSPTDTIMKLSVTANPGEDVIMRQGLAGDDESDVTEVAGTIADGEATISTALGDFVDGSGGVEIKQGGAQDYGVGDTFLLPNVFTAGSFSATTGTGNGYVSFWFKDKLVNGAVPQWGDFALLLNEDATPPSAGSETIQLGQASGAITWINGVASTAVTTALVDNTWYFVTVYVGGTTDIADDTKLGLDVLSTARLATADELYMDGVVLHNEGLLVDLAGNTSFDTTPTDAVDCSLQDNGTTLAIGSAGVISSSSAKVFFAPTDEITGTDYQDIITNGTKSYSVVCDTSSLIVSTINNDSLTPSIQTGSSNEGVVTRGGFWWSANEVTKTVVYWLGDVASKVSGSTLNY